MKVSLSIPDEDIRFLDNFAREHGIASRSAAVQRSIAMLREVELKEQYKLAMQEWRDSPDAELWERTAGDGITDA
ncbi:ribbon-helix-helix domain-containing protein [Glycomyces algeriensis]|nr:ribbon-helix-helix domain-containing protein [Glycomyces algeriensis]MDA1365896.1 ribbon-helix-helix domain-containing protein [Glycomyces algeriensis]MDR7349338.1 metal-responsive CopG/Arc/MetJ family transcriptional regulator [Glycomyces algeriensis]